MGWEVGSLGQAQGIEVVVHLSCPWASAGEFWKPCYQAIPIKPGLLEPGPRRPCVSELPSVPPCAAGVGKTASLSGGLGAVGGRSS